MINQREFILKISSSLRLLVLCLVLHTLLFVYFFKELISFIRSLDKCQFVVVYMSFFFFSPLGSMILFLDYEYHVGDGQNVSTHASCSHSHGKEIMLVLDWSTNHRCV